jgi:hypothetical protein
MFPLFDFSCCVSTTRGTQLARLWSWDTLEANSSRGLESNLDLGGPLYQSNSHRSQLQLHHPMQFNHLIPFRGQSQQTSSQDRQNSPVSRSQVRGWSWNQEAYGILQSYSQQEEDHQQSQRSGPSTIAKLANTTPINIRWVYGSNYSVWAVKRQLISGGPHLVHNESLAKSSALSCLF